MAVRAVKDQQGRVRTGRVGAQGVGSGSGGPSTVLYTYDFIASPSLPATLTLSRATVGTYFDSSGVLQSAAIDAARFDNFYNGSAWVKGGLLVEMQRTNYINDITLNIGSWQAPGGGVIIGTGIAGIDGTTNAVSITPNATTNQFIFYNNSSLASSASPHVMSLFLKPNGYTKYGLREGAAGASSIFLLSGAGSVFNNINLGGNTAAGAIRQRGSWYRASTIITPSGSIGVGMTTLPLDNAYPGGTTDPWVSYTWTPNGTSGVFAQFPQAEIGGFVTSFINGAGTTRSADLLNSAGTLTTQLAAGPSVWEFQDQATDVISRVQYAAGAFNFPTSKWYRSFGVYPSGTDTSPYLTVGGAY